MQDDTATALTSALKQSMVAKSDEIIQNFASILVPCRVQVKKAHTIANDYNDARYVEGLNAFDTACETIEQVKDEVILKKAEAILQVSEYQH